MSQRCVRCNEVIADGAERPYAPGELFCKTHGGTLKAAAVEPVSRAERAEQRAEAAHAAPQVVIPPANPKPLLAGSPPLATAVLAAQQAEGAAAVAKAAPTIRAEAEERRAASQREAAQATRAARREQAEAEA